ncbi:putative Protein Skeletor, isoforms B/C [Hypsibius exemplaris]|uniref:DM13 domain-containing protein n=1 Tax=Hypsibius exemplaris TaxID=2072580 RepID=A0A9X6NNQ6_HYPEX|nr:putative Protein Skeletor, isoforms B/C [Hypsibius exemplaris]
MFAQVFALGALLVVSHAQQDGLEWLGTFETLAHGINGEVYAEDDHTLVIKSFVYDGESEDAFFILTKTENVEEPFEYLADELGSKEPLGTYMNEDIRLRLRPGTTLADYKTLSVYCNKYKVDFGHVVFGKYPKPMVRSMVPLGKLTTVLHGVTGDVLAIDESTLLLKNFNYDGMSEDGQFVLFKDPSKINETHELLRDEDGTTNPMVQYRDMDVILSLKQGAKLSMYKGFAVYCAKYNVVFGTLVFPKRLPKMPHAVRRRSTPVALGQLTNGQVHNTTGTVFRVDDNTILITRFTYDGMSPDGQFILTRKPNVISEPADIVGDERGNLGPLRKYFGQDVFINLNQGSSLKDYTGFAVYCAKYKLDFGHVFFPAADKPAPAFSLMSSKVNMKNAKKLGSFLTLGHNVTGELYALDEQTLFLKNLTYDGTSNDGRFVLSKSQEIEEPLERLGDEWGSKDGILGYDGKNIVLRLNPGTKLSDYKALSIYCADYKLDFGHVIFGQDLSGLAPASKNQPLLSAGSMW